MERYTTSFFISDQYIQSNLMLTEEGEKLEKSLQQSHDLGLIQKVGTGGYFEVIFHPWVFDYQIFGNKRLRKYTRNVEVRYEDQES